MATLRSWLRRSPQPARLRIRVDDEDRYVELSADARNRWVSAEEACEAMRAQVVECLDANGAVLRARRLVEQDETPDDSAGDYDRDRARDEKLLSRERRDMAAIISMTATACNTAFDRGKEAASQSQEHLLALVVELTQHLSVAITNLHNVSISFAQQQQGARDDDGGNAELLQKVLGLAAGKALGGENSTKGRAP